MADLVPVEGGAWSGLLFDNPRSGLAPRLTSTFTFQYRDVVRDYGETPVTLTLDWIPLSVPGWRGMAGQRWHGTAFGEDGEASVYFFMHHRFEHIELRIAEQAQDGAVYVAATVSGDIDGLGIDSLHASAWLPFDGITVALRRRPLARRRVVSAGRPHRHDRPVADARPSARQSPVRRSFHLGGDRCPWRPPTMCSLGLSKFGLTDLRMGASERCQARVAAFHALVVGEVLVFAGEFLRAVGVVAERPGAGDDNLGFGKELLEPGGSGASPVVGEIGKVVRVAADPVHSRLAMRDDPILDVAEVLLLNRPEQ